MLCTLSYHFEKALITLLERADELAADSHIFLDDLFPSALQVLK